MQKWTAMIFPSSACFAQRLFLLRKVCSSIVLWCMGLNTKLLGRNLVCSPLPFFTRFMSTNGGGGFLGLDFYGCIRLINYIRSEIAQSHVPDFTTPATFLQDEKYLRPVLEDDALLFGLGDEEEECIKEGAEWLTEDQKRIRELEERLKKLELAHSEYREAVNRSLEMRLVEDSGDKKEGDEDDSHYFESYSGNGECF